MDKWITRLVTHLPTKVMMIIDDSNLKVAGNFRSTKMKVHYLVLVFSLALTSCNKSKKTIDPPNETNPTELLNIEPNDDSIRIVAKKIVNGESIWGRNEKHLFSVLDSLTSRNPETRSICFKAFARICDEADGYVGEAIGGYVLRSFEFDPKEFIQNSKTIPDSTFQSMGCDAGIEILMSNDSEVDRALEVFIATAKERTKALDASDQKRMDSFFSMMKKCLDLNREN